MTTTSEGKAWYADWFDRSEYHLVYKARDDADARKLEALIHRVTGLPIGARILDMACGRGRHSRLLAERGYHVTGIDLSQASIADARSMAARLGLEIDFQTGDMRDAACEACFEMVVNLFTSFGYFENKADDQRAIDAMAGSLVARGWLVQDFLNADYVVANLVPSDERREGDLIIKQRRWVESGRLRKSITLEEYGESKVFHESVRLLGVDDFKRFYAAAGLEIVHIFGDYDGASFGDDAPRLILFSRLIV